MQSEIARAGKPKWTWDHFHTAVPTGKHAVVRASHHGALLVESHVSRLCPAGNVGVLHFSTFINLGGVPKNSIWVDKKPMGMS